MSGLRQLLLMTLLISGLGTASAQEPQINNELSQELVSARIQTLRDSGSQEGAETTIGSYEAVLNWLGEAQVHAASEKTYVQAQIDAPVKEAEIRDRMETMEYRSADIDLESVAKLSEEKLEEQLTSLRLKLRESQTKKGQLDEKVLSEQSSAPSIQVRFSAIDNRLQELPGTPIIIEPDLQPSQFEASQWAVLAERRALNAERRALEAQLSSQSVRYSRRKAESEELALILDGLTFEIAALEKELASRAKIQESETSIGLDESTPGFGFIQQLVNTNSKLREQAEALDKTLIALKAEKQQVEKELLSLNDRYEGVKTLVSLAEDSTSLGPVLMVHWHQTDGFRLSDTSYLTPSGIGDHVIQRTRYEDTLNTLSNTTNYVAKGLAAEVGSPAPELDEKLVETAKDLVRSQRELLAALIASETELVNTHSDLERSRTKLGEQAEEYQAYLGRRILWVPSHPPLSSDVLDKLSQETRGLFDTLSALRFANLSKNSALVLILAIALLAIRGKIDSRLKNINKKIGRVRDDSILFTLQAALLSFIRLLPVPLLLLLLANSLQSPDPETAPYLAQGLEQSIKILLLLMLVRTACLEFGIARTHFAWPAEYCDSMRRLSTRLLVWWFPLVVITAFIFKVELNSISAVLGRLLFCVDMIIFTVFLFGFLAYDSKSLKSRSHLRFWLLALTLGVGVYFIGSSIFGYLYSAQVVWGMLINSLVVIIVLLFFYDILHRWLLVVRRRLRFNEMLAARQAPKDGETQEPEHEEVNLVSLSESVSTLLRVGTVTTGAFLLFFIWAPLFRALEVMHSITLWTINDMAEGEAILTSITLASLVMALLIGIFTIVAARNMPPLLSLILRSQKNVSQGTRYAVVKLLGYLIISVGLLAFLSTLGLRWDRLQWLVAALGVGIGFGLQEIIANFISGLIILFERPIRVGDVITVGESSGQVIRIRIRATTIRDFDGKELLVPNKEFVTGRLLNWTLSDSSIRMTLDVGIAYGSDVRKAVAILEDILDKHELIADDPEPDVIFNKFGDSSLNLTARYFFTDVQQRGFLLSDLHTTINEAFAEAGIVIAFPQIDVHFDREDKTDILEGEPQAT
ncbi:MAG: mechanosensitive ion channel domain-containing protein [Lysobacterales bacterium]